LPRKGTCGYLAQVIIFWLLEITCSKSSKTALSKFFIASCGSGLFYVLWSIYLATVKTLNTGALLYTIPLIFIILLKYSLNIETGSESDPVLPHDKTRVLPHYLFESLV
jgi:hypothetical protein